MNDDFETGRVADEVSRVADQLSVLTERLARPGPARRHDDIVQMIPADGWVAIYRDDDGGPDFHWPLMGWVLQHNGQIAGMAVDDGGSLDLAEGDQLLGFKRLSDTDAPETGPAALEELPASTDAGTALPRFTTTDTALRATEQIHAAVDQLAAAIGLADTDNTTQRYNGRHQSHDAVLDGIRAYLLDPLTVSGALTAMASNSEWAARHEHRAEAAALMQEAAHRTLHLATHRLAAQETTTRDARVSVGSIASMVTNDIGAPDTVA